MNAYLVDYQLDVLQVRTFGVQAGLVMPVFRQGKRGLFLSNTDNDIHNIMDYNDKLVYPDKIRVNLYYLSHYSFFKDLEMIVCTVLGRKMMYGGEWI